jgi:NAD(P)-dependent dehydrogenase (short-subunit alcohol dehydrogenase family)
MSRLKNKIIIVTGGSGLIGSELVANITKEEGFAINADINIETTRDLALLNCDITNNASIDECIQLVIKKYGRIDGIVNNAYPRTNDWGVKFEEIPFQSWQQNVDWQLNSCFYLIQQVSKYFILQKEGSIVNIASIYGMVGPDFGVYEGTTMTMPAAYSAIKGGLINFTRYLAAYLGQYNVRVNAVSPGGIFNNQNTTFVNNYNSKVPLKRMGLPVDIAPTVSFLLSNEASYITGQNIAIDGGWTAI